MGNAITEIQFGFTPTHTPLALWGRWEQAGYGMGLVGLRRESSPCEGGGFPGVPGDSGGCSLGAQGEGEEFLKNSINQTKALEAGRGSSSCQVLPAS